MGRVNVIETVYFLYFLIYSISLGRTSKFATTAKKKKNKNQKTHVYKINYIQAKNVPDPHEYTHSSKVKHFCKTETRF